MRIDSDKQLPDSHIEGTPLPLSEPIRFVWDKTPKQSVHNGRMKTRFIADLKAHRRLYKHVPDRDFSKKNLDSAFDQAFVTFRQKFKVQRDESAALLLKQKEDGKALKARRLARKKTVRPLSFPSRTLLTIMSTHRNFQTALTRAIASKLSNTSHLTEHFNWNACHQRSLRLRTNPVHHPDPVLSIAFAVYRGAAVGYAIFILRLMKVTKPTKAYSQDAELDVENALSGQTKMGFSSLPRVWQAG